MIAQHPLRKTEARGGDCPEEHQKAVPVSMSQEIHLHDQPDIDLQHHAGHDTDIFDIFEDANDMNTLVHVNGDDIDDILIESTTVQTDCIDFGSRALHHKDVPNCHHYNVYDMIMARAKELP